MFNKENSIEYLKSPVLDFYNWLNTNVTIKEMHFESLDLNIDLMLTCEDFLYIGGNISKHNFTRLSFCAKEIKGILKRSKVNVDLTDSLLALEDFQKWFHGEGNILGYLSSSIVEFLNNIRWGIHRYLMPEFYRAYTPGQGIQNSYQYPDTVSNPTIKGYYWDLMNKVRMKPYLPEFKVSIHFKNHPLLVYS